MTSGDRDMIAPWQVRHHETLAEHGQRLTSLESRVKATEAMQKDISSLASSVAVMAHQLSDVRSDTTDIKTEIGKLRAIPGSRWEMLIRGAVTALIGGLAALMIAKLYGGN